MDKYVEIDKYRFLLPPMKLDYDNWTPKQAKENLEWFINHVDERADYVLWKSVKKHLPEGKIDSKLLIKVWKWFLKKADIEKVPEEELKNQRKLFGHFGESLIAKEQLSIRTEYIVRDIGMLVSAMYMHNYPGLLRWDVDCKPKSYIFVNRPVIKGFVDMSAGKPFNMAFPPVHMVGVQAVGILHNDAKKIDLYNLYCMYEKKIPTANGN